MATDFMLPKRTWHGLAARATLAFILLTFGSVFGQAVPGSQMKRDRIITIDEAIQLALTNDVDILILKQNPIVDEFALDALYSAYDPAFGFSALHSFENTPGGLNQYTGQTVSFLDRNDIVGATLSGALPFGTTFQLTGPQNHQSGPFVAGPASYSGSAGVSVNQPLLRNFWIDTPRWNIALGKKTLLYDQLALRGQVETVINNLKAAYYVMIYDRESVEVQKKAVALAQELAAEDKKKAQLGAMTPLDAASAEAQAAASQSDLLTAQLTLANQENAFKQLLALDVRQWANVTPVPAEQLIAVPENPDVFECWRTALEARADIRQARINLEKQKITIKYDYNQLFPELDLQASYQHNGAGYNLGDDFRQIQSGATRSYSYGAALTVPLENIGARSSYKASKVTFSQLQLQLRKVQNTIMVAIQNDVATVLSDFQKIDTSRTARVYAEQALEAEQTKLDHGKSTTLLVLQAQQTLTQDRSAEIQALADYNIAVAQLDYDQGIILERNHIGWANP